MRQRRVKSLPRHGRVFVERVGVDERARGGETFVPGFHAIPRFRERIFVVILLEWQRRVQQKVTRFREVRRQRPYVNRRRRFGPRAAHEKR